MMTKPNVTNSIQETTEILGISRSTLYRLTEQGEISPIRIGSRRLFTDTEIERFLETRQSRVPGK